MQGPEGVQRRACPPLDHAFVCLGRLVHRVTHVGNRQVAALEGNSFSWRIGHRAPVPMVEPALERSIHVGMSRIVDTDTEAAKVADKALGPTTVALLVLDAVDVMAVRWTPSSRQFDEQF